ANQGIDHDHEGVHGSLDRTGEDHHGLAARNAEPHDAAAVDLHPVDQDAGPPRAVYRFVSHVGLADRGARDGEDDIGDPQTHAYALPDLARVVAGYWHVHGDSARTLDQP